MRKHSPCYKCPKRHRACHSNCPDYVDDYQLDRVCELAARAAESIVAGYSVDANAKIKKKANRR